MTAIRDKSRRRRLLLACVTALGAFVVVYFANATYHELLLDKVGLSQALVDALGAAAAVLVSFLAQQMLSVARYRDPLFFTPVNEPMITAMCSGFLGIWNDRRASRSDYMTALTHVTLANLEALARINADRPAWWIGAEGFGCHIAVTPEDEPEDKPKKKGLFSFGKKGAK